MMKFWFFIFTLMLIFSCQVFADDVSVIGGAGVYVNGELQGGGGSSVWTESGDDIYNSNSGNVGIGTSSPTSELEVKGDIELQPNGAIKTLSGNIRYQPYDGTLFMYNGSQSYNLSIYAASAETVSIKSNASSYFNGGNVGIGVTDPESKLEVKASGATGAPTFYVTDNSDNKDFVVLDNGNVGIGTTSPRKGLQVQGDIVLGEDDDFSRNAVVIGQDEFGGELKIYRNNTEVAIIPSTGDMVYSAGSGGGVAIGRFSTDARLSVKGYSTNDIAEFRNSADTILNVIDSNGNVGIGTTDPSEALHVKNGDVELENCDLLFAGDGGGLGAQIDYYDDCLDFGTKNGIFYFFLHDDQFVGINKATPNAVLDIDHSSFHTTATDLIQVENIDGDDILFVKGAGNVGIGTSDPTAKLDVNGDLTVSGNVYCQGKLTSEGGNDPLYVGYVYRTRAELLKDVKREILPTGKLNQAVLFFNQDKNKFEVYFPEDKKFKTFSDKRFGLIEFLFLLLIIINIVILKRKEK